MIRRLMSAVVKRMTSTDAYNEASIASWDIGGTRGEKRHTWSYREPTSAQRSFNSWVAAAARINAQAVASVPIRMYVRKRPGLDAVFRTRSVPASRKRFLLGEGRVGPADGVRRKLVELGSDFEEVIDIHPAMELLRTVNPYWNGFNFCEYRMLHWQLTGNSYVHPVFSQATGVPESLWPMPSQWTWIIPDEQDWIRGYVYGQSQSDIVDFEFDEVIHWRRSSPSDLFYGMGWVEEAWPSICLHHAKRTHDTAMFDNGARPDYAVIFKDGHKDDALNRFENRVNQQLRGVRNAGRMMAFGNDARVTPLSFPPKDMGDRDEIVEEIAAASGVPVSMLKANDPNLASAETGYSSWREMTIAPMCRMDEQELNESYLPLWGDQVAENSVIAYDNPVPENREFALNRRTTLVAGGIMTINEARSEEGLEDIDSETGDVVRVNGQSLALMDEQAETGGSGVSPLFPMFPSLAPSPAPATLPPVVGGGERGVKSQARVWATVKADTPQDDLPSTGAMPGMTSRLAGVFGDLARAVAEAVGGRTTPAAAQDALIRTLADPKWTADLEEAVGPFVEEALTLGGDAGLDRIGLSAGFDVTNPRVQAFVNDYVVRLSRSIHGTTQIQLADMFGDALERGASMSEIAADLRDWGGDDVSGVRAEMIARTESARAYVEGEEAAWEESGEVVGKHWLLAPNACEFCTAVADRFNEKNASVKLGEPFIAAGSTIRGVDGGTMRLDYDPRGLVGPPLHPNCRCDIVPVLKG